MSKHIILPCSLAVSVALASFAATAAFAQTAGQVQTLAISPLTFEITANPGDVITNAVRLFNGGTDPIEVVLHVEDFAPTGETGQAVIEAPESTTYSIVTWTSLETATLALGPGEVGIANFTLHVPANAEPGGHYGAITAEARGAVGAGGSGTAIAQKVAALLLVSVAGNVEEKLAIESFSAPRNVILDASAVTLTSRFSNSGSVHLKPRGFVTITDMFGKEVAQVALDQRNVLPQTKRVIETTWRPEGFTIGRMRATLTAIYGSTNEPLTASTEFWVIPMRVVGPILTALAILLVVGFLLRRRLALAFSVLVKGKQPTA